MKRLFILTIFILCGYAHARTLHYGDYSVELTATKNTSPALHVQTADQTWYGAMFDATNAPHPSLHISYNGNEYFVGKWCDAGTYSIVDGVSCAECGIGYYCMGGKHRAPCTGGAIACPGTRNAADATADASLMNRFLTQGETQTYIPATDISQWELISVCNENSAPECNDGTTTTAQRKNMTICGCVIGTLQPGTYLFREYYHTAARDYPAPKSQIAVFDHAVGYMSQHSGGIFETLIDTNHSTFQSYTIETIFWDVIAEFANVTNMPMVHNIYVYKLK